MLNPGDLAESGSGRKPVLKVAQIDPLRVDVVLPAALFGQVKPGTEASVVPQRSAVRATPAPCAASTASSTPPAAPSSPAWSCPTRRAWCRADRAAAPASTASRRRRGRRWRGRGRASTDGRGPTAGSRSTPWPAWRSHAGGFRIGAAPPPEYGGGLSLSWSPGRANAHAFCNGPGSMCCRRRHARSCPRPPTGRGWAFGLSPAVRARHLVPARR